MASGLKPFGWHINVQHRGKIFRQLRLAVISQRVLLSELPRLDMKGPDSEAELRALRAMFVDAPEADWRCLSGSTMAPFPHPAHRTGQASAFFLLDPHFGGDGLVMVIRHRDPDKTWTIRHPSGWRPNWYRRQGLAVDGPTVRRRTAQRLESEWRE